MHAHADELLHAFLGRLVHVRLNIPVADIVCQTTLSLDTAVV